MPEDDLDDLEQSTWVRLLERLRSAPEIASLQGFASGVAKNVIREHKRTLSRTRCLIGNEFIEIEDLSADAHPFAAEAIAEHRELASRVERAKSQLTPCDRWLLEARFIDDASYADILPRFRRLFGRPIYTEKGLRSAVFNARCLLLLALEIGEREAPRRTRRA